MAPVKGTFLKSLLGELSLDRALLQILDKPYIKDPVSYTHLTLPTIYSV